MLTSRGANCYYRFFRPIGSLFRHGRCVGKRFSQNGRVAERRQGGVSHGCRLQSAKAPLRRGFLFSTVTNQALFARFIELTASVVYQLASTEVRRTRMRVEISDLAPTPPNKALLTFAAPYGTQWVIDAA